MANRIGPGPLAPCGDPPRTTASAGSLGVSTFPAGPPPSARIRHMPLVDLASLADIQRRTIRWHTRATIVTVCLGLGVTTCAFLLQGRLLPAPMDTLLKLGGGFLSLLGTWPYKEILAARNRLSLYRELETTRTSAQTDDRKRIDDLVDEIVRKTLAG